MSILQRVVREPVLIVGLVTALFGILVAFGTPFTETQIGSIVAFIGLVMALLRAIVTPSAEVVAKQSPSDDVAKAGPAFESENGVEVVVVPANP